MYSPYSVSDLKRLCALNRIRPSKSRGQNFLVDERVAEAIAAAVPAGGDAIEIGPGFGALTFALAERAKRVVAIEIEAKLAQVLRGECERRGLRNIEIYESDFFVFLSGSPIRACPALDAGSGMTLKNSILVSSLPYSIASDFFSAALCDECLPAQLVLIVQREVAERLAARPPHMSLLSVVTQWYGRVDMVQRVPRSAFWPQPVVESAVVTIDTTDARVRARREGTLSRDFFSFVRPAFRYQRKKIANTLSYVSPLLGRETTTTKAPPPKKGSERSEKQTALLRAAETGLPMREAPVSPGEDRGGGVFDRRPSELSVDDWLFLYKNMKKL